MGEAMNLTDSLPDFDLLPLCFSPTLITGASYLTGMCNHVRRLSFIFVYPVLLILCLAGNTMNVMVFRVQFLRNTGPIHFLKIKAVCNMVFMTGLLFEFGHSISLMVPRASPSWEWTYWNSKPYRAVLTNACGSLASWCTLAATVQTYWCVTCRQNFRRIGNGWPILLSMVAGAILLQVPFALVNSADLHTELLDFGFLNNTTTICTKMTMHYRFVQLPGSLTQALRTAYFWSNSLLGICLPVLGLLVFSILISIKYPTTVASRAISGRRKCVLRITLVTALTHLVLEGPGVLPLISAAIPSIKKGREQQFCILTNLINFMALANATVPFFLFLAYNTQFRQITQMGVRTCWSYRQLLATFHEGTIMNSSTVFDKSVNRSPGRLLTDTEKGILKEMRYKLGFNNRQRANTLGDIFNNLRQRSSSTAIAETAREREQRCRQQRSSSHFLQGNAMPFLHSETDIPSRTLSVTPLQTRMDGRRGGVADDSSSYGWDCLVVTVPGAEPRVKLSAESVNTSKGSETVLL